MLAQADQRVQWRSIAPEQSRSRHAMPPGTELLWREFFHRNFSPSPSPSRNSKTRTGDVRPTILVLTKLHSLADEGVFCWPAVREKRHEDCAGDQV